MSEQQARLALENQVEASLIDLMLKEDGVPHFMHSLHDRAYHTLWQFQEGWGYVETPARFASGVQALLDLMRSNKLSDSED
jgi:hypothetical protein